MQQSILQTAGQDLSNVVPQSVDIIAPDVTQITQTVANAQVPQKFCMQCDTGFAVTNNFCPKGGHRQNNKVSIKLLFSGCYFFNYLL